MLATLFTTIILLEKSSGEEVTIIVACQQLFGEVQRFFPAGSIMAHSFSVADDEMTVSTPPNFQFSIYHVTVDC